MYNLDEYESVAMRSYFIPPCIKHYISNETVQFILLHPDLKYPLRAANFAVIYCFITTEQKLGQKEPTTAKICLFLTNTEKILNMRKFVWVREPSLTLFPQKVSLTKDLILASYPSVNYYFT